jgi:hypothetical protein
MIDESCAGMKVKIFDDIWASVRMGDGVGILAYPTNGYNLPAWFVMCNDGIQRPFYTRDLELLERPIIKPLPLPG